MRFFEIVEADISWVEDTVSEYFGSPRVVSRGKLHRVRELPGYIAREDANQIGMVQYLITGDECEIIVLISTEPHRGVGRALIDRVRQRAMSEGCRRIWLITTNDNREAIHFYSSLGWKQKAIHRGAVRKSRKLKPEIPEFGSDGTPIEDEIEFELILEGG